eukprot:TRINITY_DN2394_c0_g1_i1.p7 TRINITY_DN2394_c0_g1~~TRINITY_DN2394_c0_g1_i1.p7  ORF type:complete len:404 (+),score=93.12 TRINITY_DN2394_c0_g1_i1:4726-5937(+)
MLLDYGFSKEVKNNVTVVANNIIARRDTSIHSLSREKSGCDRCVKRYAWCQIGCFGQVSSYRAFQCTLHLAQFIVQQAVQDLPDDKKIIVLEKVEPDKAKIEEYAQPDEIKMEPIQVKSEAKNNVTPLESPLHLEINCGPVEPVNAAKGDPDDGEIFLSLENKEEGDERKNKIKGDDKQILIVNEEAKVGPNKANIESDKGKVEAKDKGTPPKSPLQLEAKHEPVQAVNAANGDPDYGEIYFSLENKEKEENENNDDKQIQVVDEKGKSNEAKIKSSIEHGKGKLQQNIQPKEEKVEHGKAKEEDINVKNEKENDATPKKPLQLELKREPVNPVNFANGDPDDGEINLEVEEEEEEKDDQIKEEEQNVQVKEEEDKNAIENNDILIISDGDDDEPIEIKAVAA